MRHVGTLQAEVCALHQGMNTLVKRFTSVMSVQLFQPETQPWKCQTCIQDPKVVHKWFCFGKDCTWCTHCNKRNCNCVLIHSVRHFRYVANYTRCPIGTGLAQMKSYASKCKHIARANIKILWLPWRLLFAMQSISVPARLWQSTSLDPMPPS